MSCHVDGRLRHPRRRTDRSANSLPRGSYVPACQIIIPTTRLMWNCNLEKEFRESFAPADAATPATSHLSNPTYWKGHVSTPAYPTFSFSLLNSEKQQIRRRKEKGARSVLAFCFCLCALAFRFDDHDDETKLNTNTQGAT